MLYTPVHRCITIRRYCLVLPYMPNLTYTMKKALLLCTVAALLSVAGCKEKELNESVQSVEDHAQLETEFSQIYDMVADLVSTEGKTKKTDGYLLPDGVTVEYTDTTYTDGDGVDLTLNFGPLDHGTGVNYKGVSCKDGRYRAGKLRIGIDKRYTEIGHKLTVATSTSELYYVGNGTKMHQITGSEVITRTGQNTFTIEITDATLKRDNGIANWSADYTLTRTEPSTEGWWGSTYELTGSASGNNANGQNFTTTITSPLIKEISVGCAATFKTGAATVSNSGNNFSLEYDIDGAQICDRVVKVLLDGKSKEITLF